MHLPTLIKNEFDRQINARFSEKPDVYNFFKHHEKRPLLEKNLIAEISKIELSHAVKLDAEKIKFIVKEFCNTFFHVALKAAEKAAVSEAERQRRLHEEHEFNEIQEMIEQNSNDTVEYYDENKK
jgi:hypothetical protein